MFCGISFCSQERVWRKPSNALPYVSPTRDHLTDLPAYFYLANSGHQQNPAHAYLTKYFKTLSNKQRCSIDSLCWTPNGHRLLTGSHLGELSLWDATDFHLESQVKAHESPLRCMAWTPDDNLLLTADDLGRIRYWEPSLKNVKGIQAHAKPIYDISFSSCYAMQKYATCSDDKTISIWNLELGKPERTFSITDDADRTTTRTKVVGTKMEEVKSVQWHPSKGILLSGSKEGGTRLWDPKAAAGHCFHEMNDHNGFVVFRVLWNPHQPDHFITASRDQTVKYYDMRHLKTPLHSFEQHTREIRSVAWHPYMDVFATSGTDSNILFWSLPATAEATTANTQRNTMVKLRRVRHKGYSSEGSSVAKIAMAHDGESVFCLAFHPLGHILASGGLDFSTKIWHRNQPGDEMHDKYNAAQLEDAEERKQCLQSLQEIDAFQPKHNQKSGF